MGQSGSKGGSNVPHPALMTQGGQIKDGAAVVFSCTVLDAKYLPETVQGNGQCDPSVTVALEAPGFRTQSAVTKTRNTNCPVWRQGFTFTLDPSMIDTAKVTINIFKDKGNTQIATIQVPMKDIKYREYMDQRFELPKVWENGPVPSIRLVFEVVEFAGLQRRSSADIQRRPSTSAPLEVAQVQA